MIFSTKPNRREILFGGIYLMLYMFVLPGLLPVVNRLLGSPLRDGQLNFVFFCVNFAVVTVIFRKYLLQSVRDALRVPFPTLWYTLLGYMGNNLLGSIVAAFCLSIYPEFYNVNDGSISAMLGQDRTIMIIGTVFLAPITEEVLYRGLIFRSLYDRSPVLAHGVTMVVFSAIHVTSYIGSFEPLHLLLCFVQYLPASYCLNFAYRYSGTIAAPILLHMVTNIAALYAMR